MKNLMKFISFTKSETRVILFIVTVLVAGFSIKYYKQVISNNSDVPYDFSKTDSEFKILSDNIDKKKSFSVKNDSADYTDKALTENLTIHDDSAGFNGQENVININTASKNELIDLPEIGESTADKIILFRKTKLFKKPEDLMNVSGIGKKKFEKIKNLIKTE